MLGAAGQGLRAGPVREGEHCELVDESFQKRCER